MSCFVLSIFITGCSSEQKENDLTEYNLKGDVKSIIYKGYSATVRFGEIEKDNGQYDDDIEIFWASGACFFIRKNVFDELNGFDENFYCHMEEIDLCWRIENLQKGYKKKFIHNCTVYHLGGGSLDYNDPKKLFYNVIVT